MAIGEKNDLPVSWQDRQVMVEQVILRPSLQGIGRGEALGRFRLGVVPIDIYLWMVEGKLGNRAGEACRIGGNDFVLRYVLGHGRHKLVKVRQSRLDGRVQNSVVDVLVEMNKYVAHSGCCLQAFG